MTSCPINPEGAMTEKAETKSTSPGFGDDDGTIRAVAHVFELMEMAWHDCYAEITPSEEVVEDVLLCSGGTLGD